MLLAQLPEYTVGKSLLETSIKLNQATVASWDLIWDEIISIMHPLWIGVCDFGIIIGAISMILVSLKMAFDYKDASNFFFDLPNTLIWPLIVIILLSSNGKILANTVLSLRSLAYYELNEILTYQVADVTFKQALADVTLTSSAKNQIRAILSECASKPPDLLKECIVEKQPVVDAIVAQAEALNGGPLDGLVAWSADVDAWLSNPGAAVTATISAFFIGLLWAMQWAFVNILEASLMLTALLAPIFTGMSVLPLGQRAIWGWASSFMGIFTAQLGYTIVIGVTAAVLVKSGAQNISDLAFLAFICIFAPILAVLIGGGGGLTLFHGISSGAVQLGTQAATGGIAIAKGAASMLGRVAERFFN